MASIWQQQRFRHLLSSAVVCLLLIVPAAVAFLHWDRPSGPLWMALGATLLLALFFGIQSRRLLLRNRALALARTQSASMNACLNEDLGLAKLRYTDLLDNAGDAFFFIDPGTGALQQINRRAEELIGYTAKEIGRLDLSALFPGRQRRRYLHLLNKVIRDGYSEEANLLFRCKDGRILNGEVHARLGTLGPDQVIHGVVRDVTDIRRIEQELRSKNRDLTLVNEIAHHVAGSRDLADMLGDVLSRLVRACGADGGGIYVVRHKGSTLHLVAHLGVTPEVLAEIGQMQTGTGLAGRIAALGKPKAAWNVQSDQRLFSAAVRRAGWRGFQGIPLVSNEKTTGVLFLFNLNNRILSREEVDVLLAVGKQIGNAIESAELFDALQWQNRLTQVSNRELEQSRSKLRQNLARMEEANRALERIDQMKTSFLAMASHELRTPLTYVLAGTQLLSELLPERLSAEEARVLDSIRQGGLRLERIIRDLIEVARIESQNVYLAREAVDVPALMTTIGRQFLPLCEERGISCTIAEVPGAVELYGDQQHLEKTFIRLLENALKFTPSGGRIDLLAEVRSAADIQQGRERLRLFSPTFFAAPLPESLLQVTVRDSGIGIAPEDHMRIFDKFYEIGDIAGHFTSQTRFGGKGVGLGLTLVKGMVEAHGGMVWVESDAPMPGSAFHVLLPLGEPAAADAPHG
ncbi:MAG TPA: ATP-binding protein [Desulfuromonadales bacterium]|nr:ATP-binding protein [Desulfuromonadales bacterium]